jgi:hypothetical protein
MSVEVKAALDAAGHTSGMPPGAIR